MYRLPRLQGYPSEKVLGMCFAVVVAVSRAVFSGVECWALPALGHLLPGRQQKNGQQIVLPEIFAETAGY